MMAERLHVAPYGPRGLLCRCGYAATDDLSSAHDLARELGRELRECPRVEDAVVAYEEVLVTFRDPRDSVQLAAHASAVYVHLCGRPAVKSRTPRVHRVGVIYDGPDLGYVAEQTGMPAELVVECHYRQGYTVQAVGFQPGFAYLGTLPPGLHLPRRSQPRPRVPAGAVAIAAGQTAVYPNESPGGWHLIGRVGAGSATFDVREGPGLAVGDEVWFEALPT